MRSDQAARRRRARAAAIVSTATRAVGTRRRARLQVAEPGDGRAPKRRGQGSVEDSRLAQTQARHDAAVGIDDGGNARVRRPHQRQALLDGAQAGGLEMLIGPGRVPEPAVVRDVEKPRRPCRRGHAGAARHHLAGEDRLVADQRAERRQARQGEGARPGAGGMVPLPIGHRREIEKRAQRDVFAERHEVVLVVGGRHDFPPPSGRGDCSSRPSCARPARCAAAHRRSDGHPAARPPTRRRAAARFRPGK